MKSDATTQLLRQLTTNQSVRQAGLPGGLVLSYRHNPAWGYRRLDVNLFFTAISVFTLQRLAPLLAPDEQALAAAFVSAATGTYPAFRNAPNLPVAGQQPTPLGDITPSGTPPVDTPLGTYNFYATNPSRHFPNGRFMHRYRHFKLPDDIDDTAMVYLTANPTAADLDYLHRKLARHANQTHQTIRNTFPEYRALRAYSTWFGERMPIEFDACALANMLYCVYDHGLPIDEHATDSLTLLADMVSSDRYRTAPFHCAHNYATTPLIAYHIARLMAAHDPPLLQPIRAKLIRDMQALTAQPLNPMEQVLLGTSLLRLGQQPPPIELADIEAAFGSFSFFIAGMLSAYEQPLLRRLAPQPFWHIRWQCDDHCRVLLIEYLVLRRAASQVR
ncbi:hypothetical protein FAES_2968 [Fibrella aestuarina BUZ 2]|uniref:Uncharacterized protein n=1 Tax=Fibrella aestuarina BUZ 2 TaxID=1166018 RepID=I0KA24_9BACT|nr:hypothetical protein [Fibrella aestuarina]CCH00977.1 hypothetical protein FAES_2968 [Fibrella aestuarina BUZ 2]